jgi:hypothetical protein
MDTQTGLQLKAHTGTVPVSLGAFDPLHSPVAGAPHGQLRGLSASQDWQWKGLTLSPEASWVHLSQGQDTGGNRKNKLRLGLTLQVPLLRK